MRYLPFIVLFTLFFVHTAHAACTSPAGAASQTRYDFTGNKLYYCDNSAWVEVGSGILPALTAARIWVGNASNAATAVTLSGDATLSNAGVLTIANNAVTTAKVNNAAISLAKLAANSVDSSKIVDGSVAAADLASNAVTEVKIANNAVTNAKIANATIIATTKLSATGTKNNTTFLRGDNTWAVPPAGGGGVPAGTMCGSRRIRCHGSGPTYETPSVSCGGSQITATCNGILINTVSCPSGYAGVKIDEIERGSGFNVYTVHWYVCAKT